MASKKVTVHESEIKDLIEIIQAGAKEIGRLEHDQYDAHDCEESNRLYRVRQFAYRFVKRVQKLE